MTVRRCKQRRLRAIAPATGAIVIVAVAGLLAGCMAQEPVRPEQQQGRAARTRARPVDGDHDHDDDSSRISDEAIPPQVDAVPNRPRPIIEIGNPLLKTGPISRGMRLPTGAVWQPSLVVFGQLRTAVQTFNDGDTRSSQWANRLDVFTELKLSGTERILFGLRPLDKNGRFSVYDFEPDAGWHDELNADVHTLFFEGDFGEIFPNLDRDDTGRLDYGFSVGRQPILAQEGFLIDDEIDSFGVTRNTLMMKYTPNLRITGLYSWGNIHRNDNRRDGSAHLFGLLTRADILRSTVDVDLVGVWDTDGESDAVYFGASSVQRIGHYNTSPRIAASFPLHGNSPAVGLGALLFTEISRTLTGSQDLAYLNAFWAIGEFSSAARGPDRGGPLGRTGILFEAVGLGNYGAALGNEANDSLGGSLGYQTFFNSQRTQLVFEAGGRKDTNGSSRDSVAGGARVQQAIGRRVILRLDGFVGLEPRGGARLELLTKF